MSARKPSARKHRRISRPWIPLQPGRLVAAESKDQSALGADATVWTNDRYTVIVRPVDGQDGWLWLSVHRNDRRPVRDWRDLQRIKTEIAGPEREAVELYPAESRLVDTANQYHLWVAPDGVRFPFGYTERLLVDADQARAAGARQRQIPRDWRTTQ